MYTLVLDDYNVNVTQDCNTGTVIIPIYPTIIIDG